MAADVTLPSLAPAPDFRYVGLDPGPRSRIGLWASATLGAATLGAGLLHGITLRGVVLTASPRWPARSPSGASAGRTSRSAGRRIRCRWRSCHGGSWWSRTASRACSGGRRSRACRSRCSTGAIRVRRRRCGASSRWRRRNPKCSWGGRAARCRSTGCSRTSRRTRRSRRTSSRSILRRRARGRRAARARLRAAPVGGAPMARLGGGDEPARSVAVGLTAPAARARRASAPSTCSARSCAIGASGASIRARSPLRAPRSCTRWSSRRT